MKSWFKFPLLALAALITTSSLIPEGFNGGTLVKTPQGYIPIEFIEPGDLVFCFNDYGELVATRVTQVNVTVTSQAFLFSTDNRTDGVCSFIADYDQLLYVIPDRDWFRANMLQRGHQLLNCRHHPVRIQAMQYLHRDITVYALSVEKYHNYFISHDDILARNLPRVTKKSLLFR